MVVSKDGATDVGKGAAAKGKADGAVVAQPPKLDAKLDVVQDDAGKEDEMPLGQKLSGEAGQGMGAFIERNQAVLAQFKSGGGDPGIDGKFGSVSVEGELPKESKAALLKPLGDKPTGVADQHKATKPEDANQKAASRFQQEGQQALEQAHRGLKVTTDGSPPKVFDYQDKFTVKESKTSLGIAKEQLGPKATEAQTKFFAQHLASLNGKNEGDPEKVVFAAGSRIKLPGQTENGGILTIGGGAKSIDWVDNSSLESRENGQGRVMVRDSAGSTEYTWDPKDPVTTGKRVTRGDTEIVTDVNGIVKENNWVADKSGQEDWVLNKLSYTDDKGRRFSGDVAQDSLTKVVVDDHGQKKEFIAKGAELVSADGKSGLTANFELYSRQAKADGSLKRTFENGNSETFDKKGNLIRTEGTDDWGRKVAYDLKPGQRIPETAAIGTADGGKVELHRKGNSLAADWLDAGGKKIGKIELGGDRRLVYTNDSDKSVHATLKDGAVLEKRINPDRSTTSTYTKGKESFVVEHDGKGHKVSETFTGADGGKFTCNFTNGGKTLDSIKLEKDGSTTNMKLDPLARDFKGDRVDASGKVVEHVSMQEDKLMFVDATTGAVRAEKFVLPDQSSSIPKFVPGRYDRDSGTFTYDNLDKSKTVESFAPGRTDIVQPDGALEGSTITGDKSSLKKNGEATVLHSNGTGVRLNADGTIDRWGADEKDNAHKEKLTPAEEKFLKEHRDIDRRDFAEVHRKLAGDAQKLDSFYNELSRLDSGKNLTSNEKTALRRDIMHHVAYLAEVYQGRSPSCNVSVVQRDLAGDTPDKYARTIIDAVSEGSVTTADGARVPLDPNNLKLQDSSGRDLASRIFQSTALAAEFYPRKIYRNSEDGVGRLYPYPYNQTDKPIPFEGLNLAHIVDVRYKLTGEEKTVAFVNNIGELKMAYDINGGGTMIAAVDGDKAPFNGGGPVGKSSGPNHVASIVGIEGGKNPRAFVHNQWGLKSDHASSETAIDGQALMNNMRQKHKGFVAPAMVLTKGDHTRGYVFKNGKLQESKDLTATLKLGISLIPGEK